MATIIQLQQQTLETFHAYIRDTEAAMEPSLQGSGPFLWSDGFPATAAQVHSGQVVAQFWAGDRPVKVSNGLIHDWIGAAFIPDVSLEKTLALLQDYDHHRNIYQPEVMSSRLISRDGLHFLVYLRILKEKIVKVVLDTDHDVQYRLLDSARALCRSYTMRVAEVQNAGTGKERVLLPDTGHGYLWRLCSYWRFRKHEGGVDVECRAISLTRDVPLGLGWLIEPVIQKLPKESLIRTLEATRQALRSDVK